MNRDISRSDRFGLLRPALDAHTLGMASLQQLLDECGYVCVTADARLTEAAATPERPESLDAIARWVRENRLTVLGFSYRLDPENGADLFGRLVHGLRDRRLLRSSGGPLKAVHFAGLPRACELVRRQVPGVGATFSGDETAGETLAALGIDPAGLPRIMTAGLSYDEQRLAFGRDLIRKGDYQAVAPVQRSGYAEFGTEADSLLHRLRHGREQSLPPLMRAHAGPFLPDRQEAVRLFIEWAGTLARSGLLDVLSIGTSQLTQSDFGTDWGDRPNGGGVPLNSADEFAAVWRAARPMLVRSYAGTRHVAELARMFEATIHMAWHALSFWWFCRIDGRGPCGVLENLDQHFEAVRVIAAAGTPLEPNVPHHFAFRGADDVTYIVSALLAARAVRHLGIRTLVLQNMLNTPRGTWGIQDLARSRVLLKRMRDLEGPRFRVVLQPRGGLDYFSPDPEIAKAQLAAVTALMDDIEPADEKSPAIVHVVSYSEASDLATPPVIDESIRIVRHALERYRALRRSGDVDDMTNHPEVRRRAAELEHDVASLMAAIDAVIPPPHGPSEFYRILASGYLPVPYLWECREEFRNAVDWQTRLVNGAMKIVRPDGCPMPVEERIGRVEAMIGDRRPNRAGSGRTVGL